MLTVNETEVSKVTLVYTANVQNISDEIMPLSPMSNGETITLSVGDTYKVTGEGGLFSSNHNWKPENENIVKIAERVPSAKITAYQEGRTTITHTYWEWGKQEEIWM